MSTATLITELNDLKAIAASNPAKTRTYRVSREVAEANRVALKNKPGNRLQPLSATQTEEMARFLEIPVQRIEKVKVEVEPVQCGNCGREMTLTDLMHQSVSIGRHDKAFIADKIFGDGDEHFITINGSDDTDHVMRCLSCETLGPPVEMVPKYNCHGGKSYAHCAW